MRLLARATALVLGALLLVVVVHTVLSPLYGAYRYDTSPVLAVLVVLAVALVPLTLAVSRVAPWLEARPWRRRLLVAAVLAGLFVLQLQIGWAIRVAPGWDASMVAGIAERMALGLPDDPGQQLYVATYPNNALIVAVLHVWYGLALATGHPDLWSAGVVLVALCMTGAVALAHLAARRLGGPVAAYLTLGLALVFVGLSPWSAVPYSDTLTMPFPALVLYLFSLERDRRGTAARAALWAAMGAATYVGYALKPTAVFASAAAVVVALVLGARAWRRSWRVLVASGAAVVGGVVAGALLAGQLVAWQGMEPAAGAAEQRLDVTHFLKMGAQQGPGVHNDYFGAYREEDAAESRATPLEDRTRANLERFGQRVADMGPLGYARFLERKAAWTLGDGSFFAWSEGQMAVEPTPFLVSDPASVRVQRWFGLHGDRYGATFSLWQGTWLLVLLLVAGAALPRRGTQLQAVPTMARLSLLMLAAFLLLFEARSRYVYLYLPYFLVLAAATAAVLAPAVSRRVRDRVRPGR
ncbi:hypothetical protein [Nocardioides sp. SYSU D00065]|uniref:hypothetical protein n=1 Tax=Nocardioides sp. SYSU D00065 TaxID=2817378 RepID=UPI001B342744|nr:hypothetical protein [Nocardioides sp. SYSU D00065]